MDYASQFHENISSARIYGSLETIFMSEAKISETLSDSLPLPASGNNVTNNRGFTLVELIVSFAIIAALAFILSNGFAELKEKTRIARAANEIRGLEKDISSYNIEKGFFPALLSDITWSHAELDPWGRAYEYKRFVSGEMRCLGVQELNADYDLYSRGLNGETDLSIVDDPKSRDDVVRLRDGAFVGTAKQFMN